MTKILIAGGAGLVGKYLCKRLVENGYEVGILSRTKRSVNSITTYRWNIEKNEIEEEAILWADCIINLAGENIGDNRWTATRKQQIVDSRVKSSELLFNKIKEQNKHLKAYISASAIGYYGAVTSTKIFTETDLPASDFLGSTCKQWEEVADKFTDLEIRTVKIRTGIVLTKDGGALSKMVTPVKLFMGSAIGTGRQYLPWIHINDLCGIYLKAIEDIKMQGAYNAVAPEHITNNIFIKTIALLLKKPLWLPNIPAFIMKMIFGEMSELLLTGSCVSSAKIKKAGYNFEFTKLNSALVDLIKPI